MAVWQAYLLLEAELKQVEDRLANSPENIDLQFDRAALLNRLGRTDDARDAYLQLLGRSPTHFGALNNLGTLLTATGFTTAARTAFAEAVKHHPNNPIAHTNLANLLAKKGDIDSAKSHFQAALKSDPNHAEAHQGLSQLLAELGENIAAREHRIKGFQHRPIMSVPYRGRDVPIAVLMLASAEGGAVPIQTHLDDRIFCTTVLIVDFFDPTTPLPPHQFVFNAIGDADICQTSLQAATTILRSTSAPVINHPSAVLATGRAANAERMAQIPNVVTPKIAVVARESVMSAAAAKTMSSLGFNFPFLLRSPGYHTGKNFIRVDSSGTLQAGIEELPGAELLLIEYLNSQGSDGKYRKYRVMLIDGQIYPMHAAVSYDWKVHYFTADMADNPEHRAEDEKFLNHMPDVVGLIGMLALKKIQDELNLEYAGIDFGLNERGEILLFEVNATMVVNPSEPDPRWDYRRAPVERVLTAIRKLLTSRATKSLIK